MRSLPQEPSGFATTNIVTEHCAMLEQLPCVLSRAIRDPLSAILLHIDLLEDELERPVADSRRRMLESLQAIEGELTRISHLVQHCLSLERQAGNCDCGPQ